MPFCPNCGREVSEDYNVCPNCGYSLRGRPPPPPPPATTAQVTVGTKNPGVAAILSFLIPGLGQMYAGRIGRGLLFLFVVLPLTGILFLFFFWLIIPLFLPLAFWIWNVYDAYNLCKSYNARLVETGRPPW